MNSPSAAFQPGDAHTRERALNPHESFIVQAPAGSGKTELLVRRMLSLLAVVDTPERIVAVTFTRKAAAEMRNRLLVALEAAAGPAPTDPNEFERWELARNAQKQDKLLGWNLLQNPTRLSLMTFDSLSLSLVSRAPWLSRFGPAPRPLDDTGEFYRNAARATLGLIETGDPHADAARRLLAYHFGDARYVEKHLASTLGKRDQWLRLLGAGDSPADARRRVEAQAALLAASIILNAAEGLNNAGIADSIVVHARQCAITLRTAGESEHPICACLDLQALPGSAEADVPAWLGIAELVLTQKGEWRSRVDRKCGFDPNDKERKDAFNKLPRPDGLQSRLQALRNLPFLSPARRECLEDLIALLPRAAAALLVVHQRAGELDFPGITAGAIRALRESESLRFSQDAALRHLLVDEFQDTSAAQFELISMLVSDWSQGDGRTLFLVGDPMQSIYGFREAEVGLFLRAQHKPIGSVHLERLTLHANFRSNEELVAWHNRVFAASFPTEVDENLGAVTYTRSEPRLPGGGAVACHVVAPGLPEARQVVDLIRNAQSIDPGGSIAVLAGTRRHLRTILIELRNQGIRYSTSEVLSLGENSVVRDLHSLTRALLNPADRVAWLALLRAPWCGLTLSDLHALCAGEEQTTVWGLLRDPARRSALSPAGATRVVAFVETLSIAVHERGRVRPRILTEWCWNHLGGPACIQAPATIHDAEDYFALLEAHTQGGEIADFDLLELSIEKLRQRGGEVAADSARPRVELMTMHKAKGLEFDTVILPSLGRQFPHEDATLFEWLAGSSVQLLAPGPPAGQSPSTDDGLYQYIRRIHQIKINHERQRLLYVAATRARKRLHLLGRAGPNGSPHSHSLLHCIWPGVAADFGVSPATEAESAAPSTNISAVAPQLRRVPAGWKPKIAPGVEWRPDTRVSEIDPSVAPLDVTYHNSGLLQRQIGTAVHGMLQKMGRTHSLTWESGRLAAVLQAIGVPPDQMKLAMERCTAALQHTTDDPRGRWILTASAHDQTEFAVSGRARGVWRSAVIDRTFVDEAGDRWIVDYKTAIHEGSRPDEFLRVQVERYRSQLEDYAELFAALETRPIRCGLYFPLLGAWHEFTPADSRSSTQIAGI